MSGTIFTLDEVIVLCKIYDIRIVRRKDRKNQVFRRKYNISYDDEITCIREYLNPGNCIKEAVEDYNYPGNVLYVFEVYFFGQWCYIKLSIDEKLETITVISFHESEE